MGTDMSNGLLLLIILLSAASAVLSGMAVFTGNRPPDSRVNQVIGEQEEMKGLLAQIQKALLQMERKFEKDQKDSRAELKDLLEKIAQQLERMAPG